MKRDTNRGSDNISESSTLWSNFHSLATSLVRCAIELQRVDVTARRLAAYVGWFDDACMHADKFKSPEYTFLYMHDLNQIR